MAVRATERRIPAGLTPGQLGQAVSSAGRYHLVSLLKSPVAGEAGKLPCRNSYVLFVDAAAPQPNPPLYSWIVEAFGPDGGSPIHTERVNTQFGVLDFDAGDIDQLKAASISRVRVTVTPTGVNAIVMEQIVSPLNEDIEALITNLDGAPNALGGDADATRSTANLYAQLITELTPKDSIIPPNLLASVMYLYRMAVSPDGVAKRGEAWEEYLDDAGADDGDVPDDPVGPCGLLPWVVAMTYPANAVLLQPVKEKAGLFASFGYERGRRKAFHTIDRNAQIDLYNRLRFPRTAIPILRDVLDGLRKLVPAWAALNQTTVFDVAACINGIASQLQIGPQDDIEATTRRGRRAYELMFTSYIETMLAFSLIKYQILKVLVLDARSGAPLPNLKVRKLLIRSGEAVVGHDFEFDYKAPATNPGESVRKQSQRALKRLGYDVGEPSSQYGDTGRRRYKEYWDARIPDGPEMVPAVEAGKQPPDYMLRLIIAEYNSHRVTDTSGVLNVRIPEALLNSRRISIDIGFWETPIALEALRSDSIGVVRAHGPEGGVEHFGISRDGDQDIAWDTSISGAGHMGWVIRNKAEVGQASYLRAALRLPIKTDEGAFEELDPDLLSRFLDDDGYHFVLFAMVWCQPVWDEFLDSTADVMPATTEHTYLQDAAAAHQHMHIVTTTRADMGGTLKVYAGKGYGKIEDTNVNTKWRDPNPPTPGHSGIDIHAKIGDAVYAVHGGEIKNSAEPSGGNTAGNWVHLDWDGDGRTSISYLHLSAFVFDTEADKVRVAAGTKVGEAGRSGNLGLESARPGHVHLAMGSVETYTPALRNTPVDDENRKCIPCNETPLLFPCKAQVTQNSPQDCLFSDPDFAATCWAPGELCCPYMLTGSAELRLQAQLRWLHEQRAADGYLSPGILDGVLGNPPNNVVMNLPNGTAVARTGNTDGRLIEIRDGGRTGWVEASLVDQSNHLVIPGGGSLGSIADAPVGVTRMAIYVFRMINNRLDYNDYASNFSMAGPAVARLDELARITAPT